MRLFVRLKREWSSNARYSQQKGRNIDVWWWRWCMEKGYLTIDEMTLLNPIKRMKSKCVENYAKQTDAMDRIFEISNHNSSENWKLSIKLLRGWNENIEKSIKIILYFRQNRVGAERDFRFHNSRHRLMGKFQIENWKWNS